MRAYAVAAGVEIGALSAAPPALEQAEAAARSEVLEHSVRESVCSRDPHVAAKLLASLMGRWPVCMDQMQHGLMRRVSNCAV